MIATLDRLMTLAQKLRDADKNSERDPVHIALELNEVHVLTRLVEDYLGDVDAFATGSSGNNMSSSYD
jgi:hypothetical protein